MNFEFYQNSDTISDINSLNYAILLINHCFTFSLFKKEILCNFHHMPRPSVYITIINIHLDYKQSASKSSLTFIIQYFIYIIKKKGKI